MTKLTKQQLLNHMQYLEEKARTSQARPGAGMAHEYYRRGDVLSLNVMVHSMYHIAPVVVKRIKTQPRVVFKRFKGHER